MSVSCVDALKEGPIEHAVSILSDFFLIPPFTSTNITDNWAMNRMMFAPTGLIPGRRIRWCCCSGLMGTPPLCPPFVPPQGHAHMTSRDVPLEITRNLTVNTLWR